MTFANLLRADFPQDYNFAAEELTTPRATPICINTSLRIAAARETALFIRHSTTAKKEKSMSEAQFRHASLRLAITTITNLAKPLAAEGRNTPPNPVHVQNRIKSGHAAKPIPRPD